jgi:glycosyltransferase involved in cell wall biosynthesis
MKPPLSIDITPLLESQWTGIPVFTRRLVQALDPHVALSFCLGPNGVAEAAVRQAIRLGTGTYLRDVVHTPVESVEGEAARPAIDPAIPLLYPSVKPSPGTAAREASVIHDISTLVMPDTHMPENVAFHLDPLRDQLASDEVVFCCSEATREALCAYAPWVRPKARIMYQYVDWPDGFEAMDRNQPAIRLGRYAVVIGTVEPRKNLRLLLRALERGGAAAQNLHFVVIGARGWMADQALAQLSPQAQARITFTGFISEFAKYRLLRHAEFLVYPSVYEGFGIPAVEAMSLGKPVLASLSSSFPEVVGPAGLFFDPFSTDGFVAALEEMANPACQAELAAHAVPQAARFHAEGMAAPVLEWLAGR